MPSILPLKMHLFLAGMMIAAYFHKATSRWVALASILALSFLPIAENTRQFTLVWMGKDCVIAFIFFLVMCWEGRGQLLLVLVRKLLYTWTVQRLGDISYSVYLVHMLIEPLVVAALLRAGWLRSLPRLAQYGCISLAILLIVLPISWLLYRWIEQPGIALGKRSVEWSGRLFAQ
jgi:peptidoglycan/LPS O-acetylase OafA/YrhL